jgi:hypothetical protein
MSEDVLELAKPALEKRIGELVEAAFKLAQFSGSSDMLERAIDRCSTQYFGTSTPPEETDIDEALDVDEPSPISRPKIETFKLKRVRRNIVVDPTVDESRPSAGITRVRAPRGKPHSYAPGKLVKASNYTNIGRPVSQYAGVSYSGSMSHPWVVRYRGKRCGSYSSELKAARIYDSLLVRDGKSPRNFEGQG